MSRESTGPAINNLAFKAGDLFASILVCTHMRLAATPFFLFFYIGDASSDFANKTRYFVTRFPCNLLCVRDRIMPSAKEFARDSGNVRWKRKKNAHSTFLISIKM